MLGIKSSLTMAFLAAGAVSLGACAAPTGADDTASVASPIDGTNSNNKVGKDGHDDDDCNSYPSLQSRGPGSREECEDRRHECDKRPSMQSRGPGSKEECEDRKERKRDRDDKERTKHECDDKDNKGDCGHKPPPPPPPPPTDDCDHDGKTW
jgi:hypothetical protein